MPNFTKEKFRDSVLENLQVLAQGQTATAEQAVLVDDTLTQILEMLDWRHLYTWDEPNGEIPGDKYRPLVHLVSNELAPNFGHSDQSKMMLQAKAQSALNELQQQTDDFDEEPVQANYF